MERIIYPFLLFLLLIQHSDSLFITHLPVPFDTMRAKWNEYVFWQPCYVGRNLQDAFKTLANCKTLGELLEYVPGKGTENGLRIRDLDVGVRQFSTCVFAKEKGPQKVYVNGLVHNDSIMFGFIELNNETQYFLEDSLFFKRISYTA